MAMQVENINTKILIQCREQIGLKLLEVAKKVPKIEKIENDVHKPTYKQLDTLADLYKVPRWVFISEELPPKYQFNKSVPAFRQFSDNNPKIFSDHRIRNLTAKIEQYRNLILNLREDMHEPVEVFKSPQITNNSSPVHVSKQIRRWLDTSGNYDFSEWKLLLEQKGVFIFLTSKYKGWSYIDREFLRGFAIYHSKIPIIVINDSDSKKAQSFTLFHELGHILRKENSIDVWEYQNIEIEKWCDELAGNVLMPANELQNITLSDNPLSDINSIAKSFKISPYACLVRLRQLQKISQQVYQNIENRLIDEFKQLQEKLKESNGGPARNRANEVITQYGHIYTTTLFQAYHNKEIGLHKLTHLFDLKKTSHVFEMEGML
ncbi:XRE family transcriptional regulator [bacterium]|nr:XRE family transcriptional regulator [bacterium]MBU1754576.1 XRE family transcriptional regulator [bacterium]